jgi:hypothetical protein
MNANRLPKLILSVLLTIAATLAQADTPRERYMRLLKGLGDAGYTTDQINMITLVATTMTSVKVCPPEEGRDSGWVAFTIEDTARYFGRAKEELVSRALELVPALIEVLNAEPTEKANFCGPTAEPEKDAPKR